MNPTDEVAAAWRAKVGALWIRTPEEDRVTRALIPLADALGYETLLWSATRGTRRADTPDSSDPSTQDLGAALGAFLNRSGRAVLILTDAKTWTEGQLGALALRACRDAHGSIKGLSRDTSKQVVFLDTLEPPAGLPDLTVLDWPVPDRETLDRILADLLEQSPVDVAEDVAKNGTRGAILAALQGLSSEGATNAICRSLATVRRIDPGRLSVEKKRQVSAGTGLEWTDPDPRGLDGVGGLDALKAWLGERKAALSPAAREWGLPEPRGVLIVGVPGAGKSLTAKATAAAWRLPLLRLDVGAVFGKYIGESEGRIRAALQTAEAVAPCVLWLDEIEKALSSGGGETDGGTSTRVLGTFLTWMQERKAPVFVIATANDVTKLPPELLRAGRWDETFAVDLPTTPERVAIAQVMGRKYPRGADVDPAEVAGASDGYTGAEIEAAFTDALYTAFSDGQRPVRTPDVLAALTRRVPLSVSQADKVTKLREWTRGRARPASTREEPRKASRALDL